MREVVLDLIGALKDAINLTEDAADELATLAVLTEDAAMATALREICRHQRINILRMQCQIVGLCKMLVDKTQTGLED